MTNILLTTDDGYNATGFKILEAVTRKAYPTRSITKIASTVARPGVSMACTPGWDAWKTSPATEVEPHGYTLDLTPVDIIYRAFHKWEEFTNRPWDQVIVGINHGVNLGFDVYHSGTCATAMAAAAGFGCCAWAFSQDLADPEAYHKPDLDPALFQTAERVVHDFMRKTMNAAGECWNVNIPKQADIGYKSAKVAHYSYYRQPPTKIVPRARDEQSDITAFTQGYVTVSELQLRVNPALRY